MRCHGLDMHDAYAMAVSNISLSLLHSLPRPRRRRVPACPSCCSFVSPRFVPIPSSRHPAPRCKGPFSARIARGRAGASAPARFACLIARARRRTHVSRPFPPGFSAPAVLMRKKAKGGPGSRLSPLILTHFFQDQALVRNYFKNFGNVLLEACTSGPGSEPMTRPSPFVPGEGRSPCRHRGHRAGTPVPEAAAAGEERSEPSEVSERPGKQRGFPSTPPLPPSARGMDSRARLRPPCMSPRRHAR